MNRRDFLKQTTVAVAGLSSAQAVGAAAVGQRQAGLIRLSRGPQVFIDDFLIAHQENLKRTIHSPMRWPHPIVTGKEDGNFQPYLTVLRDPETPSTTLRTGGRAKHLDGFRMWYCVAVSASQSHIGYMESNDGIHWIRPHRVLEDPSDPAQDRPAKMTFGMSVIDEGRHFRDPAHRYKLAWWTGGLWVATSPDGLMWRAVKDGPVLAEGVNDIVSLARDPIRNRYMALFKIDSTPADGYKGRTPNAAEGYRRCVGQSVSKDCMHWEPARRIIKPDDRDEGITEFYSIGGVVARGDLLIGLLRVLRDDLPCDPGGPVDGIGYTVLAWSRDGENWERDGEPFFDRNHQPGTWDHAMAWMDCQLFVGDEVYIYYGGYARGHKVERFTERQIGVARMKRDRYVSRDAGSNGGILRTPPVMLDGSRLTLNARTNGEIRARLLSDDMKPVRGFDWKDCAPIHGDGLSLPVNWKKPLTSLRGKPVQIDFRLRDAQLFALEAK